MNQVLRTIFVLTLSAAVSGLMIKPLESNDKGDNFIQNVLDSVEPRRKKDIAEAFETSLLGMFDINRRPRPKKDIKIPEYLIDLYNKFNAESESDEFDGAFTVPHRPIGTANTIRSFYHNDEKEHLVQTKSCGHGNCVRYWFNVTNIPNEEQLTAAEFRLFIDRDNSALNSVENTKLRRFKAEIYEIMKPEQGNSEAITRLIDVKHIHSKNDSVWTSLDAHPAVLKWKKSSESNHGIEIRILPHTTHPSNLPLNHVRLRRSTSLAEKEWHAQRPILVTYTDDKRQVRTKRETNVSKSKQSKKRKRKQRKNKKGKRRRRKFKKRCKRKPLYVDFAAVGWTDWIYAPPGYKAYYCQGECEFPYPEFMNATNHAIVQDLVNSINPRKVPKPCCVPTDLSPIPLLYVDEFDQVLLKTYQNMKVEGCGCR